MIGYTKGAQTEIFALRPSPIQVLWIGYRQFCLSTFSTAIELHLKYKHAITIRLDFPDA